MTSAVNAQPVADVVPVRTRRRFRPGLATVGGAIVALFVVMAVAPGLFSGQSTTALNVGQQFLPPSLDHLFGTDEVGRDIFSRVVHGARYTLSMASSSPP
jgi:peptide/nickel transport system permease protein